MVKLFEKSVHHVVEAVKVIHHAFSVYPSRQLNLYSPSVAVHFTTLWVSGQKVSCVEFVLFAYYHLCHLLLVSVFVVRP
jgi:hypothetical protein